MFALCLENNKCDYTKTAIKAMINDPLVPLLFIDEFKLVPVTEAPACLTLLKQSFIKIREQPFASRLFRIP